MKYDNCFETDKIPLKQIRYGLMNETTLNNFYQKFSMIDTTQLMIETDNNEILIKLDNKINNFIKNAVLSIQKLFQAEIRLNRGLTVFKKIIY